MGLTQQKEKNLSSQFSYSLVSLVLPTHARNARTGIPGNALNERAQGAWWAAERDLAMRAAAASVDLFVAPSLFLRDRFIQDWVRPLHCYVDLLGASTTQSSARRHDLSLIWITE